MRRVCYAFDELASPYFFRTICVSRRVDYRTWKTPRLLTSKHARHVRCVRADFCEELYKEKAITVSHWIRHLFADVLTRVKQLESLSLSMTERESPQPDGAGNPPARSISNIPRILGKMFDWHALPNLKELILRFDEGALLPLSLIREDRAARGWRKQLSQVETLALWRYCPDAPTNGLTRATQVQPTQKILLLFNESDSVTYTLDAAELMKRCRCWVNAKASCGACAPAAVT